MLVDRRACLSMFGRSTITIGNLLQKFIEHREHNVLKLKMTYLLIVNGILLGGDKKKKIVPFHITLIEDLNRFLAFPWGRSAYLELQESLDHALDTKKQIAADGQASARDKKDKFEARYTMKGFPIFFQVFSFHYMINIKTV